MILILAYIIKYYKLDFNEYKDLFTLLTQYRSTLQHHSLLRGTGVDFSCDITSTGYKLKIEQQTYDIPFADVEGFEVVNLPLLGIKRPYDTKLLESLKNFLSKKFNMTYSSDLITAYFDYKQTSNNNLASSYVPENHTWLAKFREAKTLEEAKDVKSIFLRIVKFCTFKDVERGRIVCEYFALSVDGIEKALQLNPDLIKDPEFIMEILSGDLFPQSLLNDQEKLETIAQSPYKDEFFNQLIIKKSKKLLAIAKVMLKDPEIKNRLNILQKYHLLSSNVVKELIEE